MSNKSHQETLVKVQETAQELEQHATHAGEKHSPLSQFEIKKIFDINVGGFDLSFTNSSLYMVISTIAVIAFMLFATRKKAMIPSRLQVMAEGFYNFVLNMVQSAVGEEGRKFFPLIFSFFALVLFSNVIGLTPYSFTSTSQIAVTLTLSMIAFLTITIFAIVRNGFGGFIHMFLPSGVPMLMAPLIFAIELLSFLIRPITLSVRLFANMVAGHVLLKVIAGFIMSLGILGILPFLFDTVMIGFELFVACLQAYIFAILICAYLGETTREH